MDAGFFDRAYARARAYMPGCVVTSCRDAGDALIFSISPEGATEPEPGLPFVAVRKDTGELYELTVPPIKNLDILEKAREIPLPE